MLGLIYDYPKFLEDKTIVLQHFKSYIDRNENYDIKKYFYSSNNNEKESKNYLNKEEEDKIKSFGYVKSYEKIGNINMFYLSNEYVQFIFNDQSKIFFYLPNKTITYFDIFGKRLNFFMIVYI